MNNLEDYKVNLVKYVRDYGMKIDYANINLMFYVNKDIEFFEYNLQNFPLNPRSLFKNSKNNHDEIKYLESKIIKFLTIGYGDNKNIPYKEFFAPNQSMIKELINNVFHERIFRNEFDPVKTMMELFEIETVDELPSLFIFIQKGTENA